MHRNGVKDIPRYLKGTSDKATTFGGSVQISMCYYCIQKLIGLAVLILVNQLILQRFTQLLHSMDV